ncbi:SGNH/GDSL hydrolase family protein [Methylobacterium sp. CM6257]
MDAKVGLADKTSALPAALFPEKFTNASCPQWPLIVAYHGDSTIEGSRGYKPAPAVFQEKLPAGFVVINEGVGGATAKMLLDGTDGKHPPWREWLAKSQAKYVIINHSLNDQSSYDVTEYEEYLIRIVNLARSYGKIVVLETPNPTRYSAILRPYVAVVRKISAMKGVFLIDQFSYLNNYMKINNIGVYDITYDGVHPTQKTHDLKGEYAAAVFASVIIAGTSCSW